MIDATPELIAFMETARACVRVDLYTITTSSGQVLRWSAGDIPVTLPAGRSFVLGPLIERSTLSVVRGVEVGELDVTISPRPTDTINGVPLRQFAYEGGLRGALVLLEWAYFDTALTFKGVLPKFGGKGSPNGFDYGINLAFKSDLEALLIQMPRDLYQPGCLNTVYGPGCGKSRAAFTRHGAVAAITPGRERSGFTSTRTEADKYFERGVLRFTTGANAGVARTVRSYLNTGGTFTFALPFPGTVAPGDEFDVYPGCDGSIDMCTSRFNNIVRFRGQPRIPAPETVT